MQFSGEPIVVGTNGDVITKTDGQEQLPYASIDLSKVQFCREQKNYLALRRPEICL